MQITLYHNPRCSKSREALQLLRQRSIEPQIIEYLKTPLDKKQLRELLARLELKPEQLARKGEEIYKAQFAGRALSDEQWFDALVAHPILIERPIAVRGERAVIGRPPERVLQLI